MSHHRHQNDAKMDTRAHAHTHTRQAKTAGTEHTQNTKGADELTVLGQSEHVDETTSVLLPSEGYHGNVRQLVITPL